MEGDLISRKAAIASIHVYEVGALSTSERAHLAGISSILERLPAVNAELVRQGQWIKLRGWDYYVCSNCYRRAPCSADGTEWLAELCNKCGAKMNVGKEHTDDEV